MKLLLAGATALLMPALASAATKTAQDTTQVYLIKNGSFTCKSCSPAFTVKADGNAHPISGHPGMDAVAVRLTSNGMSEYDMKGGKIVKTTNVSVSADGRFSTTEFTDSSGPGKPLKGLIVSRRVAPAPKGSHPLSGSWQAAEYSGDKPRS